MTDLQECRRKIDEIDNQMVELFEKRMKVCEEVAEYKIRTGKKVLDPEREHAKLEEIRKKAHGEFNELGARSFFSRSWLSAESASISFSPSMVRKKRKTSKWWSSFPEIM